MTEKNRKEDRRIRYTKQVIKETFLKLLEKNSFSKITVKQEETWKSNTGDPWISGSLI